MENEKKAKLVWKVERGKMDWVKVNGDRNREKSKSKPTGLFWCQIRSDNTDRKDKDSPKLLPGQVPSLNEVLLTNSTII